MRSEGRRVLNVVARWEEQILWHRQLEAGEGIEAGPEAGCALVLPEALLAQTQALVEHEAGGCLLSVPPGGRLVLHASDESGAPARVLSGGERASLSDGERAELELGAVRLQLFYGERPESVRRPAVGWDLRAHRGTLVSFGLHALVLLLVAAIPPDGMALTTGSFAVNPRFIPLLTLAKEDKDRLPAWLLRATEGGGGGRAAPGPAGRMGKKDAPRTGKRAAVKGSDDRFQPAGAMDVQNTGALAALRSSRTLALLLDPTKRALGDEAEQALGGLVGNQVGEDYGVGGLSLSGPGRGGGCEGGDPAKCGFVGVGKGDLGRIGPLKGPGSGDKWGPGHRASLPPPKAARIHVGGGEVVHKGGLSKEIIRRVVKQHRNEISFCYQRELQANPRLGGRLVVRFVIQGNGRVAFANVAESELQSRPVEGCVTQAVRRWEFPAPQGGGLVDVTYPFVLRSAGQLAGAE
ncbi:MAG: AgmX/PglI C-terminal domain-containing protein [Deltaproteobacteria bacterium]|nr:AgmX/PglI C-terminal domain-containing protein [Deltaproteobacteria bacterium]